MTFFGYNHIRRLLPLFLFLCIFLSSCSTGVGTQPGNNVSGTSDSRQFAEFTDTIFKESISSDALSLNYTLANPEKYGVSTTAAGFQPVSYEEMQRSAPETENLLCALEDIDKSKLTLSQQILYDSLDYTLQMELKGQDFLLFSRPLSPVTGLQAQLPVLLAEYTFDCEDDIKNYFTLLKSIPDYFESLLSFGEIQAEKHMLPCRSTLENIIAQCSSFVGSNGEKILTKSFSKRMKSCDFLDKSTRRSYREENKKLVETCLIPAYDSLIEGLNCLCGQAGKDGALASYPEGKKYYQYLFATQTGSSTGVEQYFQELNDRLNHAKQILISYAAKDPSLFTGLSAHSNGHRSPEDQLASLSTAIMRDFPQASDVNFTVSYVDPSLEDFLSPAFYLTPPLDNYTENVIYINGSNRFADSDLAPTLAHEGYPGHLYQNVYFRLQNRPLLSYALNFSGYTEGWATYAENYSYKYFVYSKDEVGILRNNMNVSLCMYGICDIGIHYYGWDETKVLAFLNEHGAYDEDTARSLYTNIIDEPGSYLKYTVGYVEFLKLKDAVKETMGNRYSELAFHTYVLSAGPAPFDVLKDYMEPLTQGKKELRD